MDNGLRILNSFVTDYKREETKFSQDSFISNMKYLTEATVIDSKIINGLCDSTIYSKYITRAAENMNMMNNVDYSYLDKFFSDVYTSSPLEDKGITIGLQDVGEIEKIRPEYLSSIPVFFDNYLKAILRGQKKKSDIDREVLSEAFKDKLKKQLVKTALVVNDTRDLMKLDSPNLVKVNEEFLSNNIIPFIRSYPSELEFMNKIAMQTIARIGTSRGDIMSSITALNEMYSSGKIDDKTVYLAKYFTFNMQSVYMSLCAYISAMLIRKMAYYTYNMKSIQHLHNVIISLFPEAESILHESVLDGDISDIESSDLLRSMLEDNLSIIIPKVHDTISRKKMEISNFAAKHMNAKASSLDDVNDHSSDYDTTPYDELSATFMKIANQLHKFELEIKDPDAIMDEIVQNLNLDNSYVSMFGAIVNRAKDTSAYDSMISNHMTDAATKSLYSEISDYENHVTDICTTAAKVYKYAEALRKSYDVTTGNMNYPMYVEAVEVMDKIIGNYKDYCLMVARALLERLDNLCHTLIEDFSDVREYTQWPCAAGEQYEAMAFNFEYDYLVNESAEVFTELMKEYKSIKAMADRGVRLVYEAEEVPAGSANGNNNQQGQNNTNGNNGSQNGSSNNNSSGNNSGNQSVKTASVQVDGKPTTKKETDAGSKDGTADTSTKGVVQAFLDKIGKIFKSWSDKLTELVRKNNGWLTQAKSKLDDLDTNKITITVADYGAVDLNDLNKMLTGAVGKINAINPDNTSASIQNSYESAAHYIFPDIPSIQGSAGFNDSAKLYFIWGKNAKSNLKQNTLRKYTGDEAAQMISTMYDYCTKYDDLKKGIDSNVDKLLDATSDKQKAILDSKSAQSKDGNGNAPYTDITKPVEDFIITVCTVCEKKYFDYKKVLEKLTPESAGVKPEKGDTTDENKKEENNK